MRNTRLKKIICVTLTLVMAVQSSVVADTILLINQHGAWILDQSSNPPTLEKLNVDSISIDSGIPKPNPTPGPDDPNPVPPQDALTKQLADISKTYVKSAQEAKALIASIDLFRGLLEKGSMNEAQLDQAITISLPVVSAQLNAGNRLKDWYAAVKAANNGKITKDLLVKTVSALSFTWNVDTAKLSLQLRTSEASLADGNSREDAAKAASNNTAEALDIAMILMIVQAILELLKALGIV